MTKQKIDQLAWQAAFGSATEKKQAFVDIWNLAQNQKIYPASINDFYVARSREKVPLNLTVPAINLRGMVYDMAQTVFKTAKNLAVGAFILELARSEMGYTNQPPQEYVAVVLAAAIRQNFTGPVFIQGDHFQVKASDQPGKPKKGEIKAVKSLIKAAIKAGFYNLDLDISTLVDYSQKDIYQQQKNNFTIAAQLTEYIRQHQPSGITVSLGGEIGHIGGKNSTEEELEAYMKGYNQALKPGLTGLVKMAIQTGTHHGGVPLPDGSLADVDIDFDTLKRLSQAARKYGMAGAVQHGASTLPDKYFSQFPQCQACEVHLATGFQNIIMDHKEFPQSLRRKMYHWLDKQLVKERKPKWTDEQFYYKLRKKAWGQFKKECWSLPSSAKTAIMSDLAQRFAFMFKELRVEKTRKMVNQWVKPAAVAKK